MMVTPARFRSVPVEVEALQWTGSDESYRHLVDTFRGKVRRVVGTLQLYAGKDGAQGWVDVPPGHWMVRNPNDNSDVWPVADVYFRAKYEWVSGFPA